MYADYSYYVDEFYGTAIDAADFPRLAVRASDFIDYYTKGKARRVTDPYILSILAKACCALAEQMLIDEQSRQVSANALASALTSGTGAIKSESVGSWSASYTTAADFISGFGSAKAYRAAYADIALQYLASTGLLYRGGCHVHSAHCNDL